MAQCISPITRIQQKTKIRFTAPCGRCHRCLINKKEDWTFRIWQEWRHAETANFITLTYDENHVPIADFTPTLNKPDLSGFIKRLKKRQSYLLQTKYMDLDQTKWKLRYFACGEYGTKTDRPHYHIIMFNLLPELLEKIGEVWTDGQIQVERKIGKGAIAYTAKYVMKRQKDVDDDTKEKPFTLTSRNPFLGYQYVSDENRLYHLKNRSLAVLNFNHKRQTLPRIYREKMFSKPMLDIINRENSELAKKMAEKQHEYWEKQGKNIHTYEIEVIEAEIDRLNNLKLNSHEHF